MKFLVVLVVAAVGVAGSAPSGLAALLSKHDMDPVKSHFQLGRLLRAPSSTHVQARNTGFGRVGGQAPCAQAPNLTPAPATLPNVTVAALQALEESVQELLATAQATGGHATLVYDQAVLWSTNFGTTLAGGQGANVTQDTVFRIGSITKVFTDLMLFHLRDAGKVDLEAQVTSIAPDYAPIPHPGFATARGASLADLGSHMAGLPRSSPCNAVNCTATIAEQLALLRNYTLISPPGTSPSYSNAGFAFLGRFLEPLAGATWEEYLSSEVLKPLGMASTSFQPPADTTTLAYGYVDGVQQDLIDLFSAAPAGQMYSSANDMAKLMSLFFRNNVPADGAAQVLDGTTIREMLTRRAHVDPSSVPEDSVYYQQFGLPWEVLHVRSSSASNGAFNEFYMMSKDGAINGYQTLMVMIPELKLGVYFAMTTGGPNTPSFYDGAVLATAFNAVPALLSMLEANPNASAPPPLPPNVDDYLGTYAFMGQNITMTLVNGVLMTEDGTQPLVWIGGDLMQMNGIPSSPCFADEGGSNDYIIQFFRTHGVVTSFSVQGLGLDPSVQFPKIANALY